MSEIINEDNVDEYIEKLDCSINDGIKDSTLKIIEMHFSNLLESNKFTEDMLSNIAYQVISDEYFSECLDNFINAKIRNCMIKNNLIDEENEL